VGWTSWLHDIVSPHAGYSAVHIMTNPRVFVTVIRHIVLLSHQNWRCRLAAFKRRRCTAESPASEMHRSVTTGAAGPAVCQQRAAPAGYLLRSRQHSDMQRSLRATLRRQQWHGASVSLPAPQRGLLQIRAGESGITLHEVVREHTLSVRRDVSMLSRCGGIFI